MCDVEVHTILSMGVRITLTSASCEGISASFGTSKYFMDMGELGYGSRRVTSLHAPIFLMVNPLANSVDCVPVISSLAFLVEHA